MNLKDKTVVITGGGNGIGKAMAIRGTPSFDFYAPDGARSYRHTGGIFDPAEFLLLGQYVASGAYRTQTFAQYRQTPAKKGS